MLIVIMHDNQDYLENVNKLAVREGIKDISFINKGAIGNHLIGANTDFIFTRGKMFTAFDRALVIVVDGRGRAERFLENIDKESFLNSLNIHKKGFVCALPFHYIKRLRKAREL